MVVWEQGSIWQAQIKRKTRTMRPLQVAPGWELSMQFRQGLSPEFPFSGMDLQRTRTAIRQSQMEILALLPNIC